MRYGLPISHSKVTVSRAHRLSVLFFYAFDDAAPTTVHLDKQQRLLLALPYRRHGKRRDARDVVSLTFSFCFTFFIEAPPA